VGKARSALTSASPMVWAAGRFWTGLGRHWTASGSGPKGGELTGPDPTGRGKLGSKYHLLVDAAGLPIAAVVPAANRHDSLFVALVLGRIVGVKGPGRGRPRRRPDRLDADEGICSSRSTPAPRVPYFCSGREVPRRLLRL
jgi:hypothetical protein